MNHLRVVQVIGIVLCGLAAAFVTFGLIRPAIAALVATVILIVWNLDGVSAATTSEKKS
jgi:hypothetical protein